MKISVNFALVPLLFLGLSSCFTLHSPSYLVSENDAILLDGSPQVQVDVSRNYILGFGGFNKKPMMAEARLALSKKYEGFLPYSLNTISVDEEKTTVFLIYNRHRLRISAHMVLADNELNRATNSAAEEVKKYDFSRGDRVTFSYDDGFMYHNLSGTINLLAGKLASIDLDEASKNNKMLKSYDSYVKLKVVYLMSKDQVDYKLDDTVNFAPRGFDGPPFYGIVVGFYDNSTVKLKLSSKDLERWNEFGGKVDTSGIIYVPTYRVFK